VEEWEEEEGGGEHSQKSSIYGEFISQVTDFGEFKKTKVPCIVN
jgi:hypothetical protein